MRERHDIEQLRHPNHVYDDRAGRPWLLLRFVQPRGADACGQITGLLDRIRGLDKSMDTARLEKIAKIKKAVSDGAYHVSAAEVARKLIDQMREP